MRIGMLKRGIKAKLHRLLEMWLEFASSRPILVLVLVLVTATLALTYTLGHLRINTYPGNMISDALPWRQDKLAFERAFPDFRDSLVLVIDAPSADVAGDAADELADLLETDNQHFEWVFHPAKDPFFRREGLLYLKVPELESRISKLSMMQPFVADVSRDPSLSGTFGILGRALRQQHMEELDLGPLLLAMSQTMEAAVEGRHLPLAWGDLLSEGDGLEGRRVLFEVMPKLEFSSLAPGEEMLGVIREAGRRLEFERRGIQLRITGAVALSIDELQSASIGAQMASLGSFVGVAAVMMIGLRSLRLVLAVQAGLVLGLIFTAAFAALALGQLNLISVAFSVMYIGIGADYGIYLCLRYREFCGLHTNPHLALRRAVRHVGGSLEIGTLTTAVGFFCFIPTSYRGVAELGIISGVGMFISLGVTLLVLPAILSLFRPQQVRKTQRKASSFPPLMWLNSVLSLPVVHARKVLLVALGLSILSLLVIQESHFDLNPLNLQDPSRESVSTFRELLKDERNSPWALSVLASSEKEALDLKSRLSSLPVVGKVITLHDFLPPDQETKLEMVDELSIVYGGAVAVVSGDEHLSMNGKAVLRNFLSDLSGSIARHPEMGDVTVATRLELAIASALFRLQNLSDKDGEHFLSTLAQDLVGGLPYTIERLNDAMMASKVGIDDLPEPLSRRWLSPEKTWRIEVRPSENLDDPSRLEAFVTSVRAIAPHATGTPVLFLESSSAVVQAFMEAFGYAILAITLVLTLSMTRKIDVVLVLLPLLLASVLTGALMVVFDVRFNFANIIALPLVFGMGVDNCIHMVHRYRTAPPQDGVLLKTSTALAVLLSAMTNISGFGNLAVSPHKGMASMGVLLTIGILATLVSSVMVLPALLKILDSARINGKKNIG